MMTQTTRRQLLAIFMMGFFIGGCLSQDPVGLAPAEPAETTVRMDFFDKPLPTIPLPNDVATRFDATSPTLRRINASLLAPTQLEQRVRKLIDQIDGWGVFQPIAIPFTGPLDIQSILDGHRDIDYDLSNDVLYLVNIDRDSSSFGKFYHLDLGNGNYPVVLEQIDGYWKNDPRGNSLSLMFEETNEDINGNGILDEGEDTDADGVLDVPNYLPGANPDPNDLGARADALMTFYEKETNTLLARPLMPLDERTTYAVVVTKRLKDENGRAVGSPYSGINHHSQTKALEPLEEVLAPQGVALSDVAFAFTFSTQSLGSQWQAVRNGLYGEGVQAHLASEFPAEVAGLEVLIDKNFPDFKDRKNVHIMKAEEWISALEIVAGQFLGAAEGSMFREKLIEGHKYVDYHVIGYFDSPQLFERFDESGELLPFDLQSWPNDLTEQKVSARSERVYFHLIVPRKEVSVRGEGKPAPMVIMGHGYTGNRFDAVTLGGYLARHGMAVVGIDCVSHGLNFDQSETDQIQPIMDLFGLGPLLAAVGGVNRSLDLNRDGTRDSGKDFWTSYLFHTRDVVRQSALDYMQLTRVFKAFDGVNRWNMDLDGDGENELAGDFDADGVVDVGGDAHIGMTGASLGGIMSSYVGAIEPNVTVTVPIAGGGGLGDIGNRSIQGGVREAVHLRVMGPLMVGTQAADANEMIIETMIPDLARDASRTLAWVEGVQAGDVLIVDNHVNDERGCGVVFEDEGTLRVRAAAASDLGDSITLRFFPAKSLKLGSTECELVEGAEHYRLIDRFENQFLFQGRTYTRHEPLVAIAEGLGLRRANPELRRFMGIGQMVLDGGDPSAVAPYMQDNPLYYSATDESSGSHTLIVTTGGDMNVPASTGISVGRASGLIEYFKADPRYAGTEHEGKPQGQILIDTHQAEAVESMMRYTNAAGEGVLMDVENFSEDKDLWAGDIKRLSPPLRIGYDKKDKLGGYSGAIFPFPQPTGAHGFDMPGRFMDKFKERCISQCAEGEDCGCNALDPNEHFDIGNFMFNMMGRYIATNGKELNVDACMSADTCDFIPEPPPQR